MTVHDLVQLTGARVLTPDVPLTREISSGYTCDLLSWVMAHGAADMAWITVQTHMNVVAVAALMDMSCVIIPESIAVDQAVLDKACEEGIAVLSSEMTAYRLAGMMFESAISAS